ncbi:MAG: GDYXXLXY domain-containing protein [Roseibium sp.]
MSDTAANEQPAMARPIVTTPWLRWGALALIQLFLIAIPLSDRLDVQMNGTVVSLELIPVDPRDLLRGDYVIINLAIGRLPADLPGAGTIRAGDDVFVGLSSQDGGAAMPVTVSKDREKAGALAIAGRVRSVSGAEIRIDYGIDAFFLPEGEGRRIERLPAERLALDVAIADDGRSLPLRLLVNGIELRSDAIF